MKHAKLTSLLTLALSSCLFLGACGSKQAKTSPSSTSKTTAQVSHSSQGTSSSKPKDVSISSSSTIVGESSTVPSSSQEEAPTPAPTQPSSTEEPSSSSASAVSGIDVNAIANGDFSSVVGTWQDDLGNQLTFDKDGLVSHVLNGGVNNEFVLVRGSVSQGKYVATLGDTSSYAGATMTIVPVGEKIPATEEKSTQGQILVGQDGVYAAAHPYYRVN